MLLVRQPKTLQLLLSRQLVHRLLKTWLPACDSAIIVKDELTTLKQYFHHLPHMVRYQLLKDALVFVPKVQPHQANAAEYPLTLWLVKCLLSPEMDHLLCGYKYYYSHVYVEEFIEYLIEESNSFKVLQLPYLTRCVEGNQRIELLLRALITKSNLITQIGLPTLCTDSTLRTIGKLCYHLQGLDVSYSSITDKGLYLLTQSVECRSEGVGASTTNYNSGTDPLLSPPPATRSITIPCKDHEKLNHVCCFSNYRTKVCHTLRAITLQGTYVTVKGLVTLLTFVDNLEDIGTESDDLIELIQKRYQLSSDKFEFPNWNLLNVTLWDTTPNRLKIIKNTFHSLKFLSLSFHYPLVSFSDAECQQHFASCAANLTRLELILTTNIEHISLPFLLKNCPILESLYVWSDTVIWDDVRIPIPMSKLKYVTLGDHVNSDAVEMFLESAVSLREIVFCNILAEDENFLLSLSKRLISKNLVELCIMQGDVLGNPRHLAKFWNSHQHIKSIGCVSYKIQDLGLGENINLSLFSR